MEAAGPVDAPSARPRWRPRGPWTPPIGRQPPASTSFHEASSSKATKSGLDHLLDPATGPLGSIPSHEDAQDCSDGAINVRGGRGPRDHTRTHRRPALPDGHAGPARSLILDRALSRERRRSRPRAGPAPALRRKAWHGRVPLRPPQLVTFERNDAGGSLARPQGEGPPGPWPAGFGAACSARRGRAISQLMTVRKSVTSSHVVISAQGHAVSA